MATYMEKYVIRLQLDGFWFFRVDQDRPEGGLYVDFTAVFLSEEVPCLEEAAAQACPAHKHSLVFEKLLSFKVRRLVHRRDFHWIGP